MIVTIDGPAGTGKSSVAKVLADRLRFEFLNTGAMYRGVALSCIRRQIPLDDAYRVADVARALRMRFSENHLYLDDEDVNAAIRDNAVTIGASVVAANPAVREQLVILQRAAAEGVNLVTEGRDQGTVVFPDASCKFFLSATEEERARRRQVDLQHQGVDLPLLEILEQQRARDARDEQRTCSPLRPASDAEVLDTSKLTLAEVVRLLETRIRNHTEFPAGGH